MSTATVDLDSCEAKSLRQLQELHVVFLVNFVAPNLVAVMQQFANRVGRLTILSSVEMESNRDWTAQWEGLDVVVQKTWTMTRKPKHPSGYQEVNYIHIPLDTIGQLRRLKPDVIVSLEMGARSLFSAIYCRAFARQTKHVLSVYASQRSEAGRGSVRTWLRGKLLRNADWVTYNGPSCQRLLRNYGSDEKRMSPWDYAADPNKMNQSATLTDRAFPGDKLCLLTVGQLSERKGVWYALKQLSTWAVANEDREIQWNLVGEGPLRSQIQAFDCPPNLKIQLHGHLDASDIVSQYQANHVMLFPTLGDEWGLVVDEAMSFGLPVVGSCHSQAVETLIESGVNGWAYDPEEATSLGGVLDRVLETTNDQWQAISKNTSDLVSRRTPQRSADQLAMATLRAIDDTAVTQTASRCREVVA